MYILVNFLILILPMKCPRNKTFTYLVIVKCPQKVWTFIISKKCPANFNFSIKNCLSFHDSQQFCDNFLDLCAKLVFVADSTRSSLAAADRRTSIERSGSTERTAYVVARWAIILQKKCKFRFLTGNILPKQNPWINSERSDFLLDFSEINNNNKNCL